MATESSSTLQKQSGVTVGVRTICLDLGFGYAKATDRETVEEIIQDSGQTIAGFEAQVSQAVADRRIVRTQSEILHLPEHGFAPNMKNDPDSVQLIIHEVPTDAAQVVEGRRFIVGSAATKNRQQCQSLSTLQEKSAAAGLVPMVLASIQPETMTGAEEFSISLHMTHPFPDKQGEVISEALVGEWRYTYSCPGRGIHKKRMTVNIVNVVVGYEDIHAFHILSRMGQLTQGAGVVFCSLGTRTQNTAVVDGCGDLIDRPRVKKTGGTYLLAQKIQQHPGVLNRVSGELTDSDVRLALELGSKTRIGRVLDPMNTGEAGVDIEDIAIPLIYEWLKQIINFARVEFNDYQDSVGAFYFLGGSCGLFDKLPNIAPYSKLKSFLKSPKSPVRIAPAPQYIGLLGLALGVNE